MKRALLVIAGIIAAALAALAYLFIGPGQIGDDIP